MRIFILHPGKASYPEIQAYKSYFSERYEVQDGSLSEYKNAHSAEDTILWCIMGYYPTQLRAKYVIHDYRSLSVGKLARLKDILKKQFNPKPDLRIFQNIEIQSAMNFKDGIPSLILPMGIPDWLLNIAPEQDETIGTYCYIGVINRERRLHSVIEAFLRNRPDNEKFVLAGPTEKEILRKFGKEPRLLFTGLLSQRDAINIASQCEYAICNIPQKYPYDYQMPTKFLEYVALGKTIICNKSPSNRMAHSMINSKVIFTDDNIFNEQEINKLPVSINNTGTLISSLTWSKVIENSKLSELL